jgi:hypothetical protein
MSHSHILLLGDWWVLIATANRLFVACSIIFVVYLKLINSGIGGGWGESFEINGFRFIFIEKITFVYSFWFAWYLGCCLPTPFNQFPVPS